MILVKSAPLLPLYMQRAWRLAPCTLAVLAATAVRHTIASAARIVKGGELF